MRADKYDDEYVEDLTSEELLYVLLARVSKEEVSYPELSSLIRQMDCFKLRLTGLDEKISECVNNTTVGQWIEARLQALETKEQELRRVITYLELHYQLVRKQGI